MENDIKASVQREIIADGPLEVTEYSYPFCSMKHCRIPYDLGKNNYVEEEYFISGFANVYQEESDRELAVKAEGLPYKTRVIVRKPKEKKQFSGRIYLDILNATNGYDHEDLWTRIYQWCAENGHGYLGITSKPVNVQALKNFDYNRYQSLNWSNGKEEPRPSSLQYASIPGTEEGLFWDMLSQTAHRIRSSKNNFFNGWEVKYLYLTGQSQSGGYLNTYIKYFQPYLVDKNGKWLYDGYMNIVAMGIDRELCQQEPPEPLSFFPSGRLYPQVPYISLGSEGDVSLFQGGFMKEGERFSSAKTLEKDKYCRCYELAGSPHFDITCPVIPCDEDIRKSGRTPHVIPKEGEHKLNDLPFAYYVNGLLEKLHLWASAGIAPDKVLLMRRDEKGELLRDVHGNVLDGLRSPFVDVPIASYLGCDAGSSMGTIGTMQFFSREKFLSLYGSVNNYVEKFCSYTQKQIEEKWITREDGERMMLWAKTKSGELY